MSSRLAVQIKFMKKSLTISSGSILVFDVFTLFYKHGYWLVDRERDRVGRQKEKRCETLSTYW